MPIPTEPIGSIPRPPKLIEAICEFQEGRLSQENLNAQYQDALRDTIRRLEATGSPVITDGEQTKPSFATYPIHGLGNLAPDGITVPFADGHVRRLPRLVSGPFRYNTHAASFLALLSKNCGLIPAPEAGPRCDKGRFPWHRRCENRKNVWSPHEVCC